MKYLIAIVSVLLLSFSPPDHPHQPIPKQSYEQLSVNLLEAIRSGKEVGTYTQALSQAPLSELVSELANDKQRIAFWVNIYNSYILLTLREEPALYKDRGAFFSKERISIAGLTLSFDDIEHGILRHSMMKYSLGYVGKLFVSDWEESLRVEEVDWRIHFALNCGANSCPPVDVYRSATLETQLDHHSQAYLAANTTYISAKDEVLVTRIMSWFRGDFGGTTGIKEILKGYSLIPQETNPSVAFAEYDWTPNLQNFVSTR